MNDLRLVRRLGVIAVAVLAGLLVISGIGEAQEPDDIFAAVRDAVARGQVDKSRLLGFSVTKTPFSQTAREGILVGLDCGVGKFGGGETVYALRPVYRTPLGTTSLKEHGIFADVRDGNKTIKTRVLRTVQLRANPGYAVGGVTMRTGLNIDGLSLTYMRIVGHQLDPAQSYVSEWIGDRKGGSENRIEGAGNPVVGVFGNISDSQHVQSLGLIYARGLAKPAVVEPVKPDPLKLPEVPASLPEKPVKPTAPAKIDPAPEVPEKSPFGKLKLPDFSTTPPASSTSDDNLAKMLPYLAAGSVTITGLFVGLIFLRRTKVAAAQQPRASLPIRADLPKPPSEPVPTLKPTDAEAIRAADAPMPSFAKPEAARIAFFTGRLVTKVSGQPHYRVYVIGDEMLFLYAGPGGGQNAVNTGQAMGGILGGLIGKAVAGEMQERTKVRQRELDKADVATLRQLASQDDNFRARASDFTSMSIEPVGFWNSLTVGPDCAAVLLFKHRQRGSYTLALLSLDDVRTATEELPGALGEVVQVKVVWSDSSLKFVKKS